MRLNFTKMHGLGNDFMIIDLVSQEFELEGPDAVEKIRAWGNRHTGIGFDQLLVLQPPSQTHADFKYRIFNADGGEVEQCGNGARCVAKLIRDHNLSRKSVLVLQTLAGDIETRHMGPDLVEVMLGIPRPADDRVQLQANGHTYEVTPVSIGNPHGVLFVDDTSVADVAHIGAALGVHPFFPEGANIGFCEVVDRNFVRLRVFERGVGETAACGSGACAAVVAGRLIDKLDERVEVSLPGGKVRISWQGRGSAVKMTGPATLVYEGHLQL